MWSTTLWVICKRSWKHSIWLPNRWKRDSFGSVFSTITSRLSREQAKRLMRLKSTCRARLMKRKATYSGRISSRLKRWTTWSRWLPQNSKSTSWTWSLTSKVKNLTKLMMKFSQLSIGLSTKNPPKQWWPTTSKDSGNCKESSGTGCTLRRPQWLQLLPLLSNCVWQMTRSCRH